MSDNTQRQWTPDALAQSVAQIEERVSKVTPGEWRIGWDNACTVSVQDGWWNAVEFVADAGSEADAEFIAAAPADIRLLLQALADAEALATQAETKLQGVALRLHSILFADPDIPRRVRFALQQADGVQLAEVVVHGGQRQVTRCADFAHRRRVAVLGDVGREEAPDGET